MNLLGFNNFIINESELVQYSINWEEFSKRANDLFVEELNTIMSEMNIQYYNYRVIAPSSNLIGDVQVEFSPSGEDIIHDWLTQMPQIKVTVYPTFISKLRSPHWTKSLGVKELVNSLTDYSSEESKKRVPVHVERNKFNEISEVNILIDPNYSQSYFDEVAKKITAATLDQESPEKLTITHDDLDDIFMEKDHGVIRTNMIELSKKLTFLARKRSISKCLAELTTNELPYASAESTSDLDQVVEYLNGDHSKRTLELDKKVIDTVRELIKASREGVPGEKNAAFALSKVLGAFLKRYGNLKKINDLSRATGAKFSL